VRDVCRRGGARAARWPRRGDRAILLGRWSLWPRTLDLFDHVVVVTFCVLDG